MSWSKTLYPSFADRAESLTTLAAAGITAPGSLDLLGRFVALQPYLQTRDQPDSVFAGGGS